MKRSCGLVFTLIASLVSTPLLAAPPNTAPAAPQPRAPAPPNTAPAAAAPAPSAAAPAPPLPSAPPPAPGPPAPEVAPAPAPGPAPAPAPLLSPAEPELVVTIRGGGVIRGVLVEKLPGQYVTIRLSTGEHRRIRWDYIEQVAAASAGAPLLAQVYFRSEDANATLQRLAPDGRWFDVCRAPCAGKVAGRGLYRVAGEGVMPSEPFRLPVKSGHVGIQTTRVSSESSRTVGGVLALGGGAVAYVGLLVFSISSSAHSDNDNDGWADDGDNERENGQATGAVMLLGGMAAGIAGLVMLVKAKTTVEVSELRRRTGSGTLTRPGFSLPLGRGFALTERGLSF